MRNLLAIERSVVGVSSTEVPDLPLTAVAWDSSADSLICTHGPCEAEALIELKRVTKNGQAVNIASWDAPSPSPTLPCDRILDLHYFSDTFSTCVVLSGGDIVIVKEDTLPGENKIEIVGSVDEGITAAAWSSDEEVLAITTGASTFLLMTRDFEPIKDVTLSPNDLNASKHVSVGWGKSETQFKGKRAMRDPTVPEKFDEGVLSPLDDGATRISWRGDGAYLAISSMEASQRRLIRVYSRDGSLDGVCEPVDNLEGPLSWRPAGNLMAGIQRFPDRLDVVFFERNGLRHGEFTLRIPSELVKEETVLELLWNGDSSVLAIYELQVGLQDLVVQWHPEKPLQLALGAKEKVITHEFIWSVFSGSSMPPNDYGIAAVVDGATLKLTPLRIANIPPPMSFREVALGSTPTDVAISPSGSRIAVLRGDCIDLITWQFEKQRLISEPETFQRILELEGFSSYRQISFLDEETLGIVYDEDRSSVLQTISIPHSGPTGSTNTFRLPHNVTILRLGAIPELVSFFYEDNQGNISLYNPRNYTEDRMCKLPSICPWIQVAIFDDKNIAFGLSQNGRLYVNDRVIVSNCTSFAVTSAHLIFTTTQHFLKFVHLHGNLKDLEVPPDDPSGDERCRNVERGSRIIHVMPTNFSLTLQMPRGNLETIFPRALVLAGVRRSIEVKHYRRAFLACRNHRVDLNILHDHAPAQFLDSIELFMDQVKNIEHIDLFLSQIREEDVSKTMYRETLLAAEAIEPALPVYGISVDPSKSKANRICDAFLKVLLKNRLPTNLQNIITAYVCKSPPDHDAALLLIGKLREENLELAEQAIIHVCFLSDVNKLYDNALGLYDLELTLMVAQQSQKDPREYLPFLQSLQEMENTRRRFTIDDHLGRYTKACGYLCALGDVAFSEMSGYIIKHELYRTALDLFKYNQEKLKVIMGLYATYLEGASRYPDAGLCYEFLGDYSNAVSCYRNAGMWQEALFSASQLQIGKQGKPALLESVVDPGLGEGFAQTSELIADCKAQLTAQVNRLRELRAKKEENPLAYFDGVTEEDAPDDVSLAPTNVSTSASLFTRYTGKTGVTAQTGASRRTSKNRKREERKRARGKKGSIYEEEYLINSIGRMIERLDTIRAETKRLLQGLVRRRMRERAIALQAQMEEILEQLTGCVKEVFEEGCRIMEEGENGEIATETKKIAPVVKPFDGIGVL
ncbi:IKI3 family-domain-containing protein [Morchella snyderi]|nr:IKI3 family-domain-containing protein [Morchella snyderi]